jgi:hypothetical protein
MLAVVVARGAFDCQSLQTAVLLKCNTYTDNIVSAQKNIFIIFFGLASGLLNGPNDLVNYL